MKKSTAVVTNKSKPINNKHDKSSALNSNIQQQNHEDSDNRELIYALNYIHRIYNEQQFQLFMRNIHNITNDATSHNIIDNNNTQQPDITHSITGV